MTKQLALDESGLPQSVDVEGNRVKNLIPLINYVNIAMLTYLFYILILFAHFYIQM